MVLRDVSTADKSDLFIENFILQRNISQFHQCLRDFL